MSLARWDSFAFPMLDKTINFSSQSAKAFCQIRGKAEQKGFMSNPPIYSPMFMQQNISGWREGARVTKRPK